MSTMSNTRRSIALVGLALLVVGCSGSKVTTKIVCGIAALSDSHHGVGAVHDSRDATSQGCLRSAFLGAAGGSQVRYGDGGTAEYRTPAQANSHRAGWRWGYRHAIALEQVEDKAGYDRAVAE